MEWASKLWKEWTSTTTLGNTECVGRDLERYVTSPTTGVKELKSEENPVEGESLSKT